jgi:hypothetical protein
MKATLLVALVATPILVFLSPSPTSQGAPGIVIQPPTVFAFTREPTVFYDVTGFTLLGELHTTLAVYNDGLVSYSARSGFLGTSDQACTVFVLPSDVKRLTRELALAGAGTLQDNLQLVLDVPLQTLTFMQPGTDTKAHTFSWLIAPGAYSDVSTILGEFIQEHVPSCPPGGIVK